VNLKNFHYLARGFLIIDGYLLTVKTKGTSMLFLPGGHIESMEGAKYALQREMQEEFGLKVEVSDFIGAIEHIWPDTHANQLEINLLFQMQTADSVARAEIKNLEPHLDFEWVPLHHINDVDLQPEPLKSLLQKPLVPAYWASTFTT
tara:strand:+ start:393 stop:833 length:441 start_codon:yes stop_codon:yes gene_type:complete